MVTEKVCRTCASFNPHTTGCVIHPKGQNWEVDPDMGCDLGDKWETKDPGTYDASDEPAVREILDCLEAFKARNLSTQEHSDVLRIAVQVHNLIRQREEARLVALTLATAFAAAKVATTGTGKLAEDHKQVQPEVERTITDLVKKHRETGRDKTAPYWPKGDV